jgi:N-acetylglucosamine malate deacetylase 1
MKLDILAFAAHPDDVELSCSGTLITQIQAGNTVGIIDLTRGELGTRGTPEIRAQEAAAASRVMGLAVRENMGFADGFFTLSQEHILEVIKLIRKYQPEIVLMNAITDRHPDHGRASDLVSEACFLAGLRQIGTIWPDGRKQEPWRPKAVYHYIQDRYIQPDFVVDITSAWDKKVESIKAFRSQFYDPQNPEPDTYISSPDFMKFIEARAQEWGHAIGVKYGEGFTKEKQLGIRNLFDLI